MSIVAATQGQTTLTGTIGSTFMAALRIPANSMGPNGHIEVKFLWSMTNSANNKQMIPYLGPISGAVGGLALPSVTLSAAAMAQTMVVARNNNAANVQTAYGAPPATAPFSSAASALSAGAVDTTQDTYINIFGNVAGAGEMLTLVHAYAVVFPAP